MKCSEFERRIYLYRELTPQEREETDLHLETCQACRMVKEALNNVERITALHRNQTSARTPEARMTDRVMSAIRNSKENNAGWLDKMLQGSILSSARYGMAAVSLTLTVLFIIEYTNAGKASLLVNERRIITGETAELNLASFHSAFLKAKEADRQKTHPLTECLANCLEKQTEECDQCANKFTTQ